MKNKKISTAKSDKYSVNKTILFFLICIFIINILMGKSLENISLQFRNKYIPNIYLECLKPFSDFSSKNNIDEIIPNLRLNFLKITKLDKHTEWDNFYYTPQTKTGKEKISYKTDKIIEEFKKNKQNIEEVTESIKKLEMQLDFLKKAMFELKNISKIKNYQYPQTETFKEKNNIDKLLEKTKSLSKENKNSGTKIFEYSTVRPLKILMIGDSQMQSIAPGLKRLTGTKGSIKIKDIAVHSSGFIRGDYYNWQKKLNNVFKEEQYDIAILLLGMNDYQNFYNDSGKVLIKETKKWEDAYHQKIRNILDILLKNTKKVYWLGMPVVRDKIYNADLIYIETVQLELAKKYLNPKLTKFSLSNVVPGKEIPYTDIIRTKDGKSIKIMRDDGIHYTVSGSEYIMRKLLDLLYQDWDIEPIKSTP